MHSVLYIKNTAMQCKILRNEKLFRCTLNYCLEYGLHWPADAIVHAHLLGYRKVDKSAMDIEKLLNRHNCYITRPKDLGPGNPQSRIAISQSRELTSLAGFHRLIRLLGRPIAISPTAVGGLVRHCRGVLQNWRRLDGMWQLLCNARKSVVILSLIVIAFSDTLIPALVQRGDNNIALVNLSHTSVFLPWWLMWKIDAWVS